MSASLRPSTYRRSRSMREGCCTCIMARYTCARHTVGGQSPSRAEHVVLCAPAPFRCARRRCPSCTCGARPRGTCWASRPAPSPPPPPAPPPGLLPTHATPQSLLGRGVARSAGKHTVHVRLGHADHLGWQHLWHATHARAHHVQPTQRAGSAPGSPGPGTKKRLCVYVCVCVCACDCVCLYECMYVCVCVCVCRGGRYPQLAASTMAMQKASVSDVLRKMWPLTSTCTERAVSAAVAARATGGPRPSQRGSDVSKPKGGVGAWWWWACARGCWARHGERTTHIAHFRVLDGANEFDAVVQLVLLPHLLQVDPLRPVTACRPASW
jgi:hypothetical protein